MRKDLTAIPESLLNRPRSNLDRLIYTHKSTFSANVFSRSNCLNKIVAIRPSMDENIMIHLLQKELFKGLIGAMTYWWNTRPLNRQYKSINLRPTTNSTNNQLNTKVSTYAMIYKISNESKDLRSSGIRRQVECGTSQRLSFILFS